MTTGAGTGTASSRREKEDTRHSVAEYYDMIEKEYSQVCFSGGVSTLAEMVFMRTL